MNIIATFCEAIPAQILEKVSLNHLPNDFSYSFELFFRQNCNDNRAMSHQDFSVGPLRDLCIDGVCVLVYALLLLHEKMDATTLDDALDWMPKAQQHQVP